MHGRRLAAVLGAPHVSSGHLLRRSIARGDPYRAAALVASGSMVPDEVVEALLAPALGAAFVLDGYPRSARQAERLDTLLAASEIPVEAVVELAVDEGTLAARMVLRAETEKRTDDLPEVFLRRVEEYRRDAPGLRAHYGPKLVAVESTGSPEEIFQELLAALAVA
jgi:adenylate kinase